MYLEDERYNKEKLERKLRSWAASLCVTVSMGFVFYLVGAATQVSFDPRTWSQFGKDLVMIPTIIVGILTVVFD